MLSRRSLLLWPVTIPPPMGLDPAEEFLRLRAAVYLFLAENLKIEKPEEIEIEDLIVQRPMRRGNVKDEVLVRFGSESERDEVIGHAVKLRDLSFPAGVRLDIPGHLQSDFKVLIQYGNEAKNHFGGEIKRSVRFFEQEYSLVLNLCLPSGKWIVVSPSEARAIIKHGRQLEDRSFCHTLSNNSPQLPSFSERYGEGLDDDDLPTLWC